MSSSVNAIDLTHIDVEYSYVLRARCETNIDQVVLELRCPAVGWWWKRKVNSAISALSLDAILARPTLEYDITLRFVGVRKISGSFASKCEGSGGFDGDKSGLLDIVDVRHCSVENNLKHFFVETDDWTLDFVFSDCIQREFGRHELLSERT